MSAGSAPRGRRRLALGAAMLAVLYVGVGAYYYLRQDRYLFFPTPLPATAALDFDLPFEEVDIEASDGVVLDAALFHAEKPRGAVYYLHGNAGNLVTWGPAATPFVQLGFDVLMLDYRGYGKSGGRIDSEAELYADAERGFDWLAKRYRENQIVVVGYSLGTGPAARVGCSHSPRLLLLNAPYTSIVDAGRHAMPILRLYPDFLFRFPLRVVDSLAGCRAPIAILHGENDQLIPIAASERLAREFKPGDQLIRIPGAGHGDLRRNPLYAPALAELLGDSR